MTIHKAHIVVTLRLGGIGSIVVIDQIGLSGGVPDLQSQAVFVIIEIAVAA